MSVNAIGPTSAAGSGKTDVAAVVAQEPKIKASPKSDVAAVIAFSQNLIPQEGMRDLGIA